LAKIAARHHGTPGSASPQLIAAGDSWTVADVICTFGLDSGFGDLSNFTRAFRAEFGVSPREYRRDR